MRTLLYISIFFSDCLGVLLKTACAAETEGEPCNVSWSNQTLMMTGQCILCSEDVITPRFLSPVLCGQCAYTVQKKVHRACVCVCVCVYIYIYPMHMYTDCVTPGRERETYRLKDDN